MMRGISINETGISSCAADLMTEDRHSPTLAASWRPLQGKISIHDNDQQEKKERSGLLQSHAFKDIGDIFASIGSTFHVFINLTPLDDILGILAVIEQLP